MLTERQRVILQTIVEDYIQHAEPVGSRTLSKHGTFHLSPATLRNEMSDLEEMGFLEQPHTSAGRIPSQKGYRYYVDRLLQPGNLDRPEMDEMRQIIAQKMDEMERVVQQTAQILSSLTNYTAIVLGPQVYEATLRHIQLIPLNDTTAVVIVVTDGGHVENRTVNIPTGIPMEEIERLIEQLNRALMGVPLYKIKSRLYGEIMTELSRSIERYEEAMAVIDQILSSKEPEGRVYVDGATRILMQPEFRDVDKVRPLLDIFGHAEQVAHVLTNRDHLQGVQVRIGDENNSLHLQHCSVITTTYSIGGRPIGVIGVLGPTRMEYARAIRVLDYLSEGLTQLFDRLYGT